MVLAGVSWTANGSRFFGKATFGGGVLAVGIALSQGAAHAAPFQTPVIDGSIAKCPELILKVKDIFGLFPVILKDLPPVGWVTVQRSAPKKFPKFRSATGIVTRSVVSFEDIPDLHDSHDQNIDLRLDQRVPDFRNIPILSDGGLDKDGDGEPDTLELEWETGLLNTQFKGDGIFFPMWAWPSVGDRVWANGYWIFDCGHPNKAGSFRTELHPLRAIASMRQQAEFAQFEGPLIAVTATDLYIHGRAGPATDVLECSPLIMVLDRRRRALTPTNCPGAEPSVLPPAAMEPIGCNTVGRFGVPNSRYPCHRIDLDHLGVPIAENYEFDICTPPRPSSSFRLTYWFKDGPSNNVRGHAPILQPVLVGDPLQGSGDDPCADPKFNFGPEKLHVTIPLADSSVTPDSVYARKIFVGWEPPATSPPPPMHFFRVNIDKLILHNDHDKQDGNRCECTFFWGNLDRGSLFNSAQQNEWIRLSDFVLRDPLRPRLDNPLRELGDQDKQGVSFSADAAFEFAVPEGQSFTIRGFGYDGGVEDGNPPPIDCLDRHFGHHNASDHLDVCFGVPFPHLCEICYRAAYEGNVSVPNDDPFSDLHFTFTKNDHNYWIGRQKEIVSDPANDDRNHDWSLFVTVHDLGTQFNFNARRGQRPPT